MKKRAFEMLRNISVLLLVGVGYYAFCKLTSLSIGCPLFKLTGVLCPGCGLTRMCFALIDLDFKMAFYYNAAFFIISPILLVLGVSYIYKYITTGSNLLAFWQRVLLILCIIVLVAFGILRNIVDLGIDPAFKFF